MNAAAPVELPLNLGALQVAPRRLRIVFGAHVDRAGPILRSVRGLEARVQHLFVPGIEVDLGDRAVEVLNLDRRIVLVDRGFAPLAWKDGALRTPPPSGEVEVTGLLRPPEDRNMFTPADPMTGTCNTQ